MPTGSAATVSETRITRFNPAYGCSNGEPNLRFPAVSGSFNNAYDFPLAGMRGIASEIDAQYNYKVVNATTAAVAEQIVDGDNGIGR